MSRIELNDGLKTSHGEMDRDHEKLIGYINQLHDAVESGRDKAVCASIIKELIHYAVTHFAMEERLMEKHQYSNTAAHKAAHARFLQTVLDFRADADANWENLGVPLLDFLGKWLTGHILHFDRELAAEMFRLPHPEPDSREMKVAGHLLREKLGLH